MDLQPEELQFLTIPQIIQESISINKQSPRTFYFITLSLIFPPSLFSLTLSSHLLSSPNSLPPPPLNPMATIRRCFCSSSSVT
ncbi:unnamed protein product [Cochlearia groenlandica]